MIQQLTQRLTLIVFVLLLLVACATQRPPSQEHVAQLEAAIASASVASTHASNVERDAPTITLDPSQGQEIGFHYQAWLSPHQEGGEEKDTPALIPQQFRSTTPSLLRSERSSGGHGMVRFTNDLSRAYVDIQIEGVKLDEINMFHLHCGKPGMLGPILVDFAMGRDLQKEFTDGRFEAVVTNHDIEAVVATGHGIVGIFTAGCPIVPGIPGDVVTVAGMEQIARQGELYFNLHTTGQTYFGDIRGQLYAVARDGSDK